MRSPPTTNPIKMSTTARQPTLRITNTSAESITSRTDSNRNGPRNPEFDRRLSRRHRATRLRSGASRDRSPVGPASTADQDATTERPAARTEGGHHGSATATKDPRHAKGRHDHPAVRRHPAPKDDVANITATAEADNPPNNRQTSHRPEDHTSASNGDLRGAGTGSNTDTDSRHGTAARTSTGVSSNSRSATARLRAADRTTADHGGDHARNPSGRAIPRGTHIPEIPDSA